MEDQYGKTMPGWAESIAKGDWEGAESKLRDTIISQAGPQYQAMKELEHLQAITRSRGVENRPKVIQDAFERTQKDGAEARPYQPTGN